MRVSDKGRSSYSEGRNDICSILAQTLDIKRVQREAAHLGFMSHSGTVYDCRQVIEPDILKCVYCHLLSRWESSERPDIYMMLRDISNQFNMKVQFIMTDLDYFGTIGKHSELSYTLSERLVIGKNNSHRWVLWGSIVDKVHCLNFRQLVFKMLKG
jgi:hypothetical protein